jgi:predicted RNase H-like HicB family nuclease
MEAVTVRRYAVLLTTDPEDPGYTATVPALPGCVSEGGTVDEALAHIREAIALYIEGLEAHGLPIPEEPVQPQLHVVEVTA